MRTVLRALVITAMTVFVGVLIPHTAPLQSGQMSQVQVVALGDFAGYKGGVIVQEQRVVVFEQLSKIFDRRTQEFVIAPEDGERAGWSGEEYREITYSFANGKYEISSKRLAREDQVPAGVLETSSCDRFNCLEVPIDPSVAALLPKNVLIKHVASIPFRDAQFLGVVYTDPSPSESTSAYATWLSVLDTQSMQIESMIEVQEYVDFCGMTVADVAGDGLPKITVYGYSQGGSGYSKTARVYGLVPVESSALKDGDK